MLCCSCACYENEPCFISDVLQNLGRRLKRIIKQLKTFYNATDIVSTFVPNKTIRTVASIFPCRLQGYCIAKKVSLTVTCLFTVFAVICVIALQSFGKVHALLVMISRYLGDTSYQCQALKLDYVW